MSTRRARIKAVTSLPPRRKNAESADIKNKKLQNKDILEKNLKSPRTPRPLTEKNFDVEENVLHTSPLLVTPAVNKEPLKDVIKTPNKNDKAVTTNTTGSPTYIAEKIKITPKHLDKNPVSSKSTIKSNISIFTSPQISTESPRRKAFVSPQAPSPKHTPRNGADVSLAKSISPHRAKQAPNTQIINENNELLITNKNVNKITHNLVSPLINNVDKDYNVPSVPESITEETVMDGIVPLQTTSSAPKPIDLLKNDIISENVEVLFDPIVPLPSPSKIRTKLRPTPKLGPQRRSSIQGSASESEDETRRTQISTGTPASTLARQRNDSHTSISTLASLPNREVNRIRNDSICSTASQGTVQPTCSASSPLKEKHYSKSRRQEVANRRAAAMRLKRENVKRDGLTMYDLIFYNPSSNPIIPDKDEMNAKEENARDAAEAEKVNKSKPDIKENDDPPKAAPVPQIKLGPNGEIILDEQSLVIKQTDAGRKVSSVVREGAWGGGGGRYNRGPRTAEWSAAETVRFYRALAAIGTDFTLMAQLFPDRSRKDLKLKFKKEEKQNGAQVDKALRSATTWDALQLQSEFDAERAEAKRKEQEERERLAIRRRAERKRVLAARELRVRNSRGSKALESTMMPGITKFNENEVTTADEFVKRAIDATNEKRKGTRTPHGSAGSITSPQFATLTLLNKHRTTPKPTTPTTVNNNTPITNNSGNPGALNNTNTTPASATTNIESGSLVVLTVNDPLSPSKKMLQTYIAHGGGRLTPVALPTTLLNSVVGYMKKGTPKSTLSTASSPHFTSPSGTTSHDNRAATTSGVIQVTPSPVKRQRHSSFTITQI
ncbi:uncharacterized protein Bdp1 [Battus philenor]|uniref:uncharacterized protein Bdp1 n=1 Tax=Battus philenor TaxID=42288 RepID=UPI0035D01806